MNDQKIIEMLFERSEAALTHLQSRFGKYCHTISYNILGNDFDAQECVNDTYLSVWNSIPPDRPKNLSVYVGHITRNISINLLIKNSTKKHASSADLVARSPYENTFVISCANGAAGYIPSQHGFELNTYEAYTSKVVPGTAEVLVDTFLEMLTMLKGE